MWSRILTGAALVVGCATGVSEDLEPLPGTGGSNGSGGGSQGGSDNPSGGSGSSFGGAPTGGASGSTSTGGAVFGGSAGVPNGGSAGTTAGSGGQQGGSAGSAGSGGQQGGSAGTGGSGGVSGSVGTGGSGGNAGSGGTFGGECAGEPTWTAWSQMSGGMTGDRVVYRCTVLQAGCSGLELSVDYLFECNESHVPNCATQNPQNGNAWTLVGECAPA